MVCKLLRKKIYGKHFQALAANPEMILLKQLVTQEYRHHLESGYTLSYKGRYSWFVAPHKVVKKSPFHNLSIAEIKILVIFKNIMGDKPR